MLSAWLLAIWQQLIWIMTLLNLCLKVHALCLLIQSRSLFLCSINMHFREMSRMIYYLIQRKYKEVISCSIIREIFFREYYKSTWNLISLKVFRSLLFSSVINRANNPVLSKNKCINAFTATNNKVARIAKTEGAAF